MPFGADNALITAAEVVRRPRRLPPRPHLDDLWQGQVDAMELPGRPRPRCSTRHASTTRSPACPWPRRVAHACTHTTISPNVTHGGQKTNMIPDVVDIDVDIRTVPGDTDEVVDEYLAEALGDLAARVESHPDAGVDADLPIDNPLWDGCAAARRSPTPAPSSSPG